MVLTLTLLNITTCSTVLVLVIVLESTICPMSNRVCVILIVRKYCLLTTVLVNLVVVLLLLVQSSVTWLMLRNTEVEDDKTTGLCSTSIASAVV